MLLEGIEEIMVNGSRIPFADKGPNAYYFLGQPKGSCERDTLVIKGMDFELVRTTKMNLL